VTSRPRVSVVFPAYRSEATVSGCLSALRRQTFTDFEVVLVDSGPGGTTGAIVSRDFPEVRCHVSPTRLLPHAARNLGVSMARGELFLLSDPDTYARPDWIERMVAAWERTGGIVVGAIANHGDRWLDTGIHICKFSKVLPGGAPRPVDNAPTANVLVDRATWETVGPIREDVLQGDASWSRRALECGVPLTFAPDAVVAHHHLESARGFLRERYRRGLELGTLRCEWEKDRPLHLALVAAATVVPVRALRIAILVTGHCARGRYLGALARCGPIVALGHLSSLAGEARAYVRAALGARSRPQ
jgi:GT2 family glycosyltransferase